jgi:hypothetical protein
MNHRAPACCLELPSGPANGVEREAALLDEAAEELAGSGADVHVAELQEGGDAA